MKPNVAEMVEAVQSRLAEVPPPSMPRHPLEAPLLEVAQHLGDSQLRALLGFCVGSHHLALCLHRVARAERGNWLITPEAQLDALVELLRSAKSVGPRPWLTVAFDDGYDDAAQYVLSRAPRYPDVEWLLFVCPEKNEKQLHFHWDVEPAGALAEISTLKAAARLPNVSLGNHTNSHQRQILLTQEEAAAEYKSSRADFMRLFGRQRHFAFPFGTPDREYELRHVQLLRELEPEGLIWSTESRPFDPGERKSGAVLPRFPIDGAWTYSQIALWICAISVRYRLQGSPYQY